MKQRGFVSLTAVLVLSALFLSLIVTVTTRSVGLTRMIVAREHAMTAAALADACVEHSLNDITRNLHYLDEQTITFTDGTCTIQAVDEDVGSGTTIRVESDVHSHIHRLEVLVSVAPEIMIESYQSVTSF